MKIELNTILGILGESRKCIMQNTNMNEHCTYTLEQIDVAKEQVKNLSLCAVGSCSREETLTNLQDIMTKFMEAKRETESEEVISIMEFFEQVSGKYNISKK